MNKKYIKITNKGEGHIINACKKLGSNVISGNNGVIPYTGYDNLSDLNITWTSSFGLTNPEDVARQYIKWINKYSKQYNLDANYLAALIEIESGLRSWIYVRKYTNSNNHSSASGLCQFLVKTLWAVVIDTNSRYGGGEFTQQERQLIGTDNNNIYRSSFDYYNVVTQTGRKARREWLHQNIIDNPEISIKAMCLYIRFIADRCSGLANSTLFCYNRGYAFASDDYKKTVSKAKGYGGDPNYHVEGVNYVFKIFSKLDNSYGYNLL